MLCGRPQDYPHAVGQQSDRSDTDPRSPMIPCDVPAPTCSSGVLHEYVARSSAIIGGSRRRGPLKLRRF
jgi:hypothetical protein